MIRGRILSSVGVVSLATGLAVSPAQASDGSEGATEVNSISMKARGQFRGFRDRTDINSVMLPNEATLPDFNEAVVDSAARNRGNIAVSAPTVNTAAAAEPTGDLGDLPSGAFVGSPTDAFRVALPRDQNTFIANLSDPIPEILVRDDVGLDASVDTADTLPSVVQLFAVNYASGAVNFNCTGTLINPRTIISAAHCFNALPSEAYGLPGAGTATDGILVSTGVDSSIRLFNTLGSGASYADGGVAISSDVIIHASSNLENGGLPFPSADIALVSLNEPITDVPALPLLLSPLTELTHVVQVGYGTFGTGETGSQGIGFLRRVGENMLGAVASVADLGDAVFPGFAPTSAFGFETSVYYFTDFDNPNRTQEELDGCNVDTGVISCDSLAAVQAIDFFDDDALPREVGTAPGDSGSPLIVDQLYDFPVVTGVLSGGFDFFGLGAAQGFGDISFYQPLFPFFEFITENTSYKYVSARIGNGVWSDPNHWTQDLDPGFFVDDGSGNLVNGVPTGPEPGVFEAGPKLGTILGNDISGNSTDPGPGLPPPGTPNFGDNTPNSSVLLGPGSTGFVPQNTDGTPGEAFANPAQYFDVILNRIGRTRVDLDVEIDKLTVDGFLTSFELPEEYEFTSIIGLEHFNGRSLIDGTFNAGLVSLFGGTIEGNGTINTDVFFNLGGALSAGERFTPGELTINGIYIQNSAGNLVTNARFTRRSNTADLITVNGDAGLAGNLFIVASGRPRFGDEITVLSANSVEGNFDEVVLFGRSPLLFAETRVEDGDVIASINALSIGDLLSGARNLESVGTALDTIRFGGRIAEFSGLFDIIDGAGRDTLVSTLSSLTPVSAFSQSTIANNFSQRFTGQLSQRTLALRGANKGAAGFSAAGNASFAIAGTAPQNNGKLGFFGTFSGSFLNDAQNDRNTGKSAFEEASVTQAGEITLGVDMHLTDNFSLGVAMTNIRNSSTNSGALQRPDDTSVAGAAYAAAQFGRGFADMHIGFARQNYGVERASQGDFSQAYRSAQGAAAGKQTFAGMRVGYAFDLAEGFEIGPVASMDYVRSDIGGYREFGAGDFGLNILDRNFTSLGAKVGAMAAVDTKVGRTGTLSAFGSVAYARELADTQDVVTATFIGAEDVPFSILNQLDPQWVSVNAGAELSLKNNFSVSMSASSDLGRGVLTNNEGRFTLNWRF